MLYTLLNNSHTFHWILPATLWRWGLWCSTSQVRKQRQRARAAGLQPQPWAVPGQFPVTPRPPLLSSLQRFSLQEEAELQTWSFHVSPASLLREHLAESLIGLGDNFSESIFFKLYLQNSEKSFFFFFPLLKVPVFQRIQTELCPGNWLLCPWVLKHTSRWGHFVILEAQLLKSSHCLPCVALTAMTSEADVNPLTPVAQSSLSESHSGTYYCMSQFH